MSPTVQTLLIGFASLALMFIIGHLLKNKSLLKLFVPLWLFYCLYHMSVGVSHGYSVASELPFLLINFALPAAAAWLLMRRR